MISPWSIVDDVLVIRQRSVPERVELVAQRRQSGLVEVIIPPCSLGVLRNQAGVLEDFEVLGDRWSADRKC